MSFFRDYRDHVGAHPTKCCKSTLFQSAHPLLGLNCLEPGQEQHVHTHAGHDTFYFIGEDSGTFTVGTEVREAGPGMTIWAPADGTHGVSNSGKVRLVVLVGSAPAQEEGFVRCQPFLPTPCREHRD